MQHKPNITILTFFALSIHDWKQGSSNQKWINIGIKNYVIIFIYRMTHRKLSFFNCPKNHRKISKKYSKYTRSQLNRIDCSVF